MAKVVLALGSNIGDKKQYIKEAYSLIEFKIGRIIKKSANYETEPWGFQSKNKFLNSVIYVDTKLEPEIVLKKINEIEQLLGRTQKSVNGIYHSRTIDIDIIFYDNIVLDTPELQIPHPLMHERMFVLEPLTEILPDYIHPVLNKKVSELSLDLCNVGV